MRRLGVLVAVASLGAGACKGSMAKIEGMRDALVEGDVAKVSAAGYPRCTEMAPYAVFPNQPSPYEKGCLSEIANALGSKKGFASPPDQVAAATAALVLVRDGRGDFVAHSNVWIGLMKTGTGSGVDALRAALATKMAEAAPVVGRRIEEEPAAKETLKAISSAIPGACSTYQWIGAGKDPKALAPEVSADHAQCVHKDLARREGLGGSYGEGTFRALEGSLALYREMERALRVGVTNATPPVKAFVERKLTVIEEATRKNDTKKMEMVPAQVMSALGELHADAGMVGFRDAGPRQDAGADAAK